jgi:endoglycosylceramidase
LLGSEHLRLGALRRLALCVLTCVALGGGTALASPKLPLGHAGRWLTDASGRVVIAHGINMVYKLAPYYPGVTGFGADDAAFLHSIGFNAVRVGIIWKALEPHPGVYDDAYLKHIAATVRTLARHGVLSLLDFHQDMYNERFQGEGAPDWAVQDDGLPAIPQLGFPLNYESMPALQRAYDHFWANSPGPGGIGLQDRYAAAWRHVARLFRSNPSVLGYELFNEPFPGTHYLTCVLSGGCPDLDQRLTSFNRRVDAAIRLVDRRKLVFYEPYATFNFGFATHVGALNDREAAFSFHDYCLSNEAQGCSTHAQTMTNAVAYVRRTRAAAVMTEFGATNSASDLRSMLQLADRNRIPWLEWAYCGCKDPTTSGPGTVQAIVIDPHKPPRGSNLELGTLRALVEPYPQVIAGTPAGWGFSRSTRTFTLRYSPARAGGRGSFGTGSITEISAPPIVFGGRYAVAATGAAVISKRGAPLVRIALCPHMHAVTITIRPSGRHRSACRIRTR